MKVELDLEETREIFVTLLDRILEEVDFNAADRAALRKWRTAMTPGSEGMRVLTAKINADLDRALENQRRSSVKKPDWR